MDEFLILVRAIHLASSAMIAGGVLFIPLVARPTLDAASLRAVEAWMRWLLAGNLLVAVASSAGWLALVAAGIAGRPVPEAIADGTAWLVLTKTQFGMVWQLRLLCAVVLAAFVLPLGSPDGFFSRRSVALATSAGVLYIAGLAWTGHAGAAAGGQRYFHLGADVFHLVAAGAWLGGLPVLALLLGKFQGRDSHSQELTYRITRRFSHVGIVSVTGLLISGLINSWFLVGSTQALMDTDYGRLLLVKIVLFLAMVSFAAANRLRHSPRLSPGATTHSVEDALRRLRRNTVAETCLGLSVLVVVAKLGTMEPVAHLASHMH